MSQAWKNRIVGYGEERPDDLLANPANWRIHPKHQQDALSGVLSEVGVVQNVLVNKRTNTLVDGHLRVTLAMRSNQPSIPVTYVDLSDAEEALILATLDPIAAMAATDAALFKDLLQDVTTGDAAIMQLLSDMAEEHGIIPPDFDPNDEWQGMPEFEQDDQMPVKQVIVSFASEADVKRFAQLVEQNVTMQTKSIWFPAVARVSNVELRWTPEGDEDAA